MIHQVTLVRMICPRRQFPRGAVPPLIAFAIGPHLRGNSRVCHNFENVVTATFDGSLDSPQLYVSVVDVLCGFRATAPKVALWFMVHHPKIMPAAAFGVLLLADPDQYPDALLLQYMGVIPTARGYGLGRGLCHLACWFASFYGLGAVMLDVDAENMFARRCYAAAGFSEEGRQVVELEL